MAEPEVVCSPSVNWSSFLKQLKLDYETSPAMGIAHGLQKDAIQNGWGARNSKKGKNWSFTFELSKKKDASYILTMTDQGTTGLSGSIYEQNSKRLPENIPADEKLARWESMFDSGGGVGPGLFGRGKLLFNVASKQNLIVYDSLTKNSEYRLGRRRIIGRNFEQYKCVLQGATAKKKLFELTGLSPLVNTGTRITIIDPTDEVIESVEGGSFLKAIEETWWEIIKKYDAKIRVIDTKSQIHVAKIPPEFNGFPETNVKGWKVYYRDNLDVNIQGSTYRVKHLHFLVSPVGKKIRQDLLGVAVHRRGMKVGNIQLTGIPDELKQRFFGYIQINPNFEDLIAETENTTHYGFAKRRKSAFRELKRTAQDHFDLFMKELGYGRTQKEENEREKRILDEAKAELDSILNTLGVPGFGTGTEKKSDFSISITGLKFPDDSNYVTFGDVISGFKFEIKNIANYMKPVFIKVFTSETKTKEIEALLSSTKVTIKDKYVTKEFCISINEKTYPKGKKVGCTLQIVDEKQNPICEKSFYFFIEVPKEQLVKIIDLKLNSADWPNANSRRVDYDQSINSLQYEITNLSPVPAKMLLKVGTIWALEHERIETVIKKQLDLSAFETKSFDIDKIMISKEKYFEIGKGKIILRCHAIALENTTLWEKVERLAESNVPFYLNMDPNYGFFEDPVFSDDGPLKPRSQADPVEGPQRWQIQINKTHPAYLDALKRGEDAQRNYLFEEMARQTIYVLLRKNQIGIIQKMIDVSSIDVDSLDADEVVRTVAYPITDRVLSEYYGGLL